MNPIMEDTDDHPMNSVNLFMLAFGQKVPSKPTMPEPDVQSLRFRLIHEEAEELHDADNLVEYLDAVGDLLYVVYGAALAAGFTARQMDAAVAEIHRSNMSKLWTKDELASAPADHKIQPAWGGLFIVSRSDGKIIKSPSYSPANLKPIIE
jgi:predicted HAD superfamily Cof-like phosphohydrolase